ncbi:TnsD family Tn7-like transposition protein [Paenibacillus sp. P36]|uniref:TnsD family Tn7-like transposition protein n=1 Tax=Paenibacillus sp. P36 TaxID=3342538 RepID=UPI0038B2D8F8
MLNLPIQFPDEDIRSIVFRYHIESGNESFYKSHSELFSIRPDKNKIFPKLHFFFDLHYKEEEDRKKFMKCHTYLPFLMPFIERSKWETLISRPTAFRSAWRIFEDRIKYCPECMTMDDLEYGMCYPHREHQLRYIEICMLHECKLIRSCDLCGEYYSSRGDLSLTLVPRCPNEHLVYRSHVHTAELNPFMTWIVESFRLMIEHYGEIDANYLLEKLIGVLSKSGYIELQGAILKSKLIEDMVAFFGEELLNKYGLNENQLLERRTVVKLFTSEDLYHHIYFYLFVVKYLVGDFNKFLFSDYEYSSVLPFSKGPWLCKNKICPSYNLPVITECIRKVNQYITGQFTCCICGYSYVQRYNSLSNSPPPKKGRVKDLGFLWRERVAKLLSEGRSIHSISKQIGSCQATIKKFKLNILDTSRGKAKKSTEVLKNEFTELMSKRGFTTRSKIRKEFGDSKYIKLMRLEREWMENLLPQRKANLYKYRDYHQLDIEAYESVNKAYKQLLTENPSQRITRILILKHTTRLVFSRLHAKKKNCFIKTKNLLDELSENQDSYLKRIFPLVLKRFENAPRNKTLNWSLIIHKLHSGYKNASPETKEWVLQKIEDYQCDRIKL